MEVQTLLNREQTMQALGVEYRTIQLLVAKGRIEKQTIPGAPKGGPHPRNEHYTAESVKKEVERRKSGVKVPGGVLTPAADAAFAAATNGNGAAVTTAVTSQVSAYTSLAQFLTAITAQLPKLQQTAADSANDFPDDRYITLDQAAKVKGMPASWIEEQIDAGRLPFEVTKRGGKRVLRGDLRHLTSRCVMNGNGAEK